MDIVLQYPADDSPADVQAVVVVVMDVAAADGGAGAVAAGVDAMVRVVVRVAEVATDGIGARSAIKMPSPRR